jgi:hypothetical protein
MRAVRYLAAIGLTLAIIVALGVSATANFYYGASLGLNDEFSMLGVKLTTSLIFSWASLAADAAKALALFLAFDAIVQRLWKESAVMFAIFTLCALWSYSSAIGFVALNHGEVTDNRGKTAAEWSQLQSQIQRLEERRQNIVAHRPESVVQAEIGALLLTPGADGCSSINGPVTQTLCPKVAELRKELGNAKAAEWLDGRLEETRTELKGQSKVSSADPYADMLSALLGITAGQATTGRAAFFATLLEFISAFGLWAVWTIALKPTGTPQGASKEVPATSIPEESASPVLDTTDKPGKAIVNAPKPKLVTTDGKGLDVNHIGDVNKMVLGGISKNLLGTTATTSKPYRPEDFDRYVKLWIDQRCKPVAVTLGSQARDLHSDYIAYCKRQGIHPVNDKHFGRAIKRLKVKTDRGDRGRAVYALRLKEVGLAQARAA